MKYGIPYQGSKNKIADWVIENLPAGECLVDLFAGGCAITHAALLSGKWDRVICNDIGDGPRLFHDAIQGKYHDEDRWISREDFFRLKDTDPYVRYCWSFGNDARDYLYSKEVEYWKRALHYARVWGDTSELKRFGIDSDGSRGDIVSHMEEYKAKYIEWYMREVWLSTESYESLVRDLEGKIERNSEELRQYLLEGLRSSGLSQREVQDRLGTQMAGHYFGKSQWAFPTKEYYEKMQTFMPALDKSYERIVGLQMLLQSLQSLQRLQSLQSLQRLQRLQRLQSDYHDVVIPDEAVVYCDIPYKGTTDYGFKFDHEAFYDWVRKQTAPVYISEYSMPEGFRRVAMKGKRALMNGKGTGKIMEEGLWVPEGQDHISMSLFDIE